MKTKLKLKTRINAWLNYEKIDDDRDSFRCTKHGSGSYPDTMFINHRGMGFFIRVVFYKLMVFGQDEYGYDKSLGDVSTGVEAADVINHYVDNKGW